MAFKHVGSEIAWQGAWRRVDKETFIDGESGGEYVYEVIRAGDVVVICAYDEGGVWLVEQPREAVGKQSLLELPAGAVDDGESPFDAARRELAEEVHLAAAKWSNARTYYPSPGICDEHHFLFFATDLSPDVSAQGDEGERIKTSRWPLCSLESLLVSVQDAKTLIGLSILRDILDATGRGRSRPRGR